MYITSQILRVGNGAILTLFQELDKLVDAHIFAISASLSVSKNKINFA